MPTISELWAKPIQLSESKSDPPLTISAFWDRSPKGFQPPEQTEEQLRRSVIEASGGARLLDYPGEVLAGVPRGAGKFIGSTLEGLQLASRDVAESLGLDPDVLEFHRIGAAGRAIKRGTEKLLPVSPAMEGGVTQAISEGVGSVFGSAAAYAAGGPLGIAVAGGAAAYSGTYNQTLELAKRAGLKGEEARSVAKKYARVSALVTGITEPFGAAARGVKIFKRLDDATGKWLGKEIAKASGAEALQEGLQEIPDEVARQAYIKERTMFDAIQAVGGAAALGGTVGVIFAGLASAPNMLKAIRDIRQEEQAGKLVDTGPEEQPSPTPPAAPAAPPATPLTEIGPGTPADAAAAVATLSPKAKAAIVPPTATAAPVNDKLAALADLDRPPSRKEYVEATGVKPVDVPVAAVRDAEAKAEKLKKQEITNVEIKTPEALPAQAAEEGAEAQGKVGDVLKNPRAVQAVYGGDESFQKIFERLDFDKANDERISYVLGESFDPETMYVYRSPYRPVSGTGALRDLPGKQVIVGGKTAVDDLIVSTKPIPLERLMQYELQAVRYSKSQHVLAEDLVRSIWGERTAQFEKKGRKGDFEGAVLFPSASEVGKYQLSYFDVNGLKSHQVYGSYAEGIAEASNQGYRVSTRDNIKSLSTADEWKRGLETLAAVEQANAPKVAQAPPSQKAEVEPVLAPPVGDVGAKQPWEMTGQEFRKEYVWHVTDKRAIPSIQKEGMNRGTFGIGGKPTYPGDAAIYARRSDVEKLNPAIESFGKGQGLYPEGSYSASKRYVRGTIPFDRLIVSEGKADPHRAAVETAMREGKPVPPSVLAEYPDLKPVERQKGTTVAEIPAELSKAIDAASKAVRAHENLRNYRYKQGTKRKGQLRENDPAYAKLMREDARYQQLKDDLTALKRRAGSMQATVTRKAEAAAPETREKALAKTPLHELPPDVATSIQGEAQSQLASRRITSPKTREALQKIIRDKGEDVGSEVQKQKARLIEYLMGRKDIRTIYEKQIGAPGRMETVGPDEFVDAWLRDATPEQIAQIGREALPDWVTQRQPGEVETPARPGLYDQETFDPLTGKQAELPLAARQESPPPDVKGQETFPAAKAQADAKAAWDALEAYGKSKQSLFSTGVDPEAWAMFVNAVRLEVRAQRLTFQQFMAKLIKAVGAKLAERLRPDLRREWDAEMVAAGGRPSARPDLAKMGTTPEVRHLEDVGDIARNRIGEPVVRHDTDLLAAANAELASNYDALKAQALSGELFAETADLDKRTVQGAAILNKTLQEGWAKQDEEMILQGMEMQDNIRTSRTEIARAMRIGADKSMGPQERASFEAHNQLMALPAHEESLIDKLLARRAKLIERRRRKIEKVAQQPSAAKPVAAKPAPKPKATPQQAARVKEATAKLNQSIKKLGALMNTPFTGGPLNPELYATIGEVVSDAVSAGLAYAELAGSMIREFGEIKYAKIESAVRDAWDKATAGISAKPLTGMQKQIESVLQPSPEMAPPPVQTGMQQQIEGVDLPSPEMQTTPQVLNQPALSFVADIDAKIVAIDKVIADRRRKWIRKNQELVAELKRNGLNVDAVLNGTADMRLAGVVIREFNAGKSSYWDKQYELWVNSIFGWGTQVANVSGTLYNTLKEGYLERFIDATVSTALRAAGLRKGGARYEELYHFTYGLVTAWSKARHNFAMTWHTEQPRFNVEHGHPETTQFEYRKAAIPAKYYGPKIRLMTRLMMAADDAAKTLAYSGQLSALAYKQSSSEGAEGDARLSRMLDLLADPYWEGREEAFDDALRWALQEPTKVGSAISSAARKIPGGRYKWPFMNTITNIFKTGIRDTPYGLAEFLRNIAQAKKTGDWSKVDKTFAKQIVGVGTLLGLALTMNVPDEPWITGTRDKNRPLHWRIPFTKTWLNYGRLEPFATSIALMVDTIEDWKRAPGLSNKLLAPIGSLIRQVDSKWFLAGSHDIIKGTEMAFRGDPEFWVPTAEWAIKLPASFIPNWLIRGPVSAAKTQVPIRRSYGKGAERLESLAKTGLRATEVYGVVTGDEFPRRDLWGRPVLKDGSPLPSSDWIARMLSMPTASKYKEMPGDRMLYAWNELHPEEPVGFGAPQRTYELDGETRYMADPEYDYYVREGGTLFGQLFQESHALLPFNLNNPTEVDMDRMVNLRTAANRMIRAQMTMRRKAG